MPETQQLETKQGFKKTKLGWIPEEWFESKLEDVRSKEKWSITGGPFGSNLKVTDYVENGEVKILQLQDIGDGIFINKSNIRTSKEKADELISCNIYPGDLIISKMGDPVARGCLITNTEKRYLMASDGIRLKVNEEKWNKVFVLNLLNSNLIRNLAKRRSIGSTRQRPPLPEQKAIANCLSTWDDALVKLDQLITAKQQLKTALMQQLLSGKKRLPGFTGEWEEKRIEDLAKEYTQKNDNNENIEVLSCTKYDGLVPSLEYFGRQVFGDDLSKYKIVPKGYFAYATNHIEEGSIGYQDFNKLGLVSPMYTVFKTDDTINDNYFFKLLKSHRLIHEYNRRMEGSIDRRGGLRWKNFKRIKLIVPSYNEQIAIAGVLNTADREIELLKTQREQLQAQKKGLMQQLLTGKKRLKVL